jgi:hypothetical protein
MLLPEKSHFSPRRARDISLLCTKKRKSKIHFALGLASLSLFHYESPNYFSFLLNFTNFGKASSILTKNSNIINN